MTPTRPDRRHVLAAGVTAAASAALAPVPARAAASTPAADERFAYEVTRSLPEWLRHLTEPQFQVMRLGRTEPARSSPLWEETAAGTYCCQGCDLTLYDGEWKVVLEIGWVFFRHSEPDAVLTAVDAGDNPYGGMNGVDSAMVELHCRRCGSHLGHLVSIAGAPMHCINGVALDFRAA